MAASTSQRSCILLDLLIPNIHADITLHESASAMSEVGVEENLSILSKCRGCLLLQHDLPIQSEVVGRALQFHVGNSYYSAVRHSAAV